MSLLTVFDCIAYAFGRHATDSYCTTWGTGRRCLAGALRATNFVQSNYPRSVAALYGLDVTTSDAAVGTTVCTGRP